MEKDTYCPFVYLVPGDVNVNVRPSDGGVNLSTASELKQITGSLQNGHVFPFTEEIGHRVKTVHRQPKLRLRAAHKLDCFFHAMHNNDIGNISEFVWK